MSRYIDADKLIDDIRSFAEYDSNRRNKDWVRRFEIAIDAQPTADVVEVVRCVDCKYYAPVNNGDHGYCGTPLGREVYPEDYCSSGEPYE